MNAQFQVFSGGNWLDITVNGVHPAPGGTVTFKGSTTITVSAIPGKLVSGNYLAEIIFSAGSQVLIVPVILNVFPTGSLITVPAALAFNAIAACASGAPQNVDVRNDNAPKSNPAVSLAISARYVDGSGWLRLSLPSSGALTPFSFSVGIDPTGLAGGTYKAYVSLAGDSTVGAQIMPVTLTVTPATATTITAGGVINGASFVPTIAPNSWVAIQGAGFTSSLRAWTGNDFSAGLMPSQLDGVSVKINNKPAYVEYISSCQINVFSPPDTATGLIPVEVDFNGLKLASSTATMQAISPAFFLFDSRHAVATHLDYTLIGAASQPGFKPAKPGEVITLWGSGFGPTNPATPAGAVTNGRSLLVAPVTIFVDGFALPASSLQYAGLGAGEVGVYLFNVALPTPLSDGEHSITAQTNGQSTPSNIFITVQN